MDVLGGGLPESTDGSHAIDGASSLPSVFVTICRSVTVVGAGALAAGAFAPINVPLLLIPGITVGLHLARHAPSARAAIRSGFGLGLGYFGVALQWSGRFGVGVWLVLAVSQAAFWLPVGWATWRARHRSPGVAVVITAAAVTVVEALRARVPLGGLEWAQPGVAAHAWSVRHAAAVVGTLGVTALLVAMAASLTVAAQSPTTARAWRPLAATVVTTAALVLVGGGAWTQPVGTMDVAVVQADPPCPGRAAVECPGGRELILSDVAASTAGLERVPDLVLWGEGVMSAATPTQAGVDFATDLVAPTLAGVTSPAPDARFYNRNVLFDADGTVLGAYAKRQPVPFGEYVPARRVLGGIQEVGRLVPNDLVRGERPTPLHLGDVSIGTVSSWEITFSRLARDAAIDSQAVVTLTTQATYGRSAVSDQLIGAAQMRAAELQRSVVVAATTGRSVVIGPDGAAGETTRLFGRDVLEDELELRIGNTPFGRVGDMPLIAAAATALLFVNRRRDDADGTSVSMAR